MKVKGNELSKIITAGDPILKSVAMPVTAFDKKLKFLVNEMKKTMYESNGVGLAAPQIAVSKRVLLLMMENPDLKLILIRDGLLTEMRK